MGPFLWDTSNKRFAIVATNYLTKWIEAEALANIQDVDMKKFVCKNIIMRFRIPKTLILDNGLQFDSRAFRKYCNDLRSKNKYSFPAYPQSNGQVEVTNKAIINKLKKRLEEEKGK